MNHTNENICPRCGSVKMKAWSELDEQQRRLVRSLPASAKQNPEQQKYHRFCERCWFEETDRKSELA